MIRRLCATLLFSLALPAHATQDLFAVTTTYEVVGSTGRIDLDDYGTTTNEFTVHSDAVVRSHGRYVFVVNRLFADNVLVLDAGDDYRVVRQFSVADTGLNPRDIEMVDETKAYVTLFESNDLLICNPLTGATLGTIDLSSFVVEDDFVEADQMLRVGDRLFVALQNLDRRVLPWAVTGSSMLVVIDTTTDTIVDADPETSGIQGVPFQVQNPYWRLAWDADRQRVLSIQTGVFGVLDGGVEVVDPFTLRSEGLLVTEAALGGDLLDFALVSPTLGWAMISRSDFSTCLVRFDPSTGATIDEFLCTPGFDLADMELSSDGRLFVGDRRAANPGVRVFDATTGAALAGPISTGLPPFDFVLLEGVPTDAPSVPRNEALAAYPNPFNPRVVIEVEGMEDGRVEIVDARGRIVAERVLQAGRAVWDGTARDGRPVASGVYRGRLAGRPDIRPVPLTLVR